MKNNRPEGWDNPYPAGHRQSQISGMHVSMKKVPVLSWKS